MSRAIRLHERHTREELATMVKDLQQNPEARQEGGLHLLAPRDRRRLDDLLLALYWHDAPKGNARMNTAAPETKWW